MAATLRLPSLMTYPPANYKGLFSCRGRRRSSTLLPQVPEKQSSVFSAMATSEVQETRGPPALDSTSEPPPVFDGTPRLYVAYACPYAQRAWIARNYKGQEDTIKLVPIDLQNRPSWYKEKVYPENKVPSLEHNNEVRGESLDLVRYINDHFEGPPLLPDDPAKVAFAEEMISYSDTFNAAIRNSFGSTGDIASEIGGPLDHIEAALSRFDDGPFFLGQPFSIVDIAYAPFMERFEPFLLEVKKYDIKTGRPKLTTWFQELNKIEAYLKTKNNTKVLVESYKKRYGVN